MLLVTVAQCRDSVAFDELLRKHVATLFGDSADGRLAHLSSLFLDGVYSNEQFINRLKLEAWSYDLSLVAPVSTIGKPVGATWVGLLLKLIQGVKQTPALQPAATETSSSRSESSLSEHDELPVAASEIRSLTTKTQPAYTPVTRQAWYYAVLLKASTHPFPGALAVKKASSIAIASEDVAKYFPLDDRLLLNDTEYFATHYDPLTREIQLGKSFTRRSSWVEWQGLV